MSKSFAVRCILFTIICLTWITANAQEPKKILAFGDSLFSTERLALGDSFPEQLETKMKELGFAGEVIGAGYGGYTTGQALDRLESILNANTDVDLLILEFGGNDLLQNIPSDETFRNMEKMINIIQAREIPILMTGLVLPFNGYQGFSNRLNYVYTDLSEKYDIPLDPFFLEGILGIPELNQADNVHPNKFGNSLIASRLAPTVLEFVVEIDKYEEIQSLLTKLDNNNKTAEIDEPAAAMGATTTAVNTKSILVFGDSLVAGYGLAPEHAFPAQLEAKLKAMNSDIIVHNAGVSGDTSSGGMARLEWVLSSYSDLDLVIVLFGGNDALRGLHPDMTRRNMNKMAEILKRKNLTTLVAGMVAPPNLGQVYGDNFNSIYAETATKHEAALYPFYLDGVAGNLELNQPDRIHPNEIGVKYIVDRISPMIHDLVNDN